MPETREDALIKSNDVARHFLGKLANAIGRVDLNLCIALGQANAAQSLLQTLPADIALPTEEDGMMSDQEDDPGHHQLEHESFRQMFSVFACHDQVAEILLRAPKTT